MKKHDIISKVYELSQQYAQLSLTAHKRYTSSNLHDDDSEVEWTLYLVYRDIYQDLYKLLCDINR